MVRGNSINSSAISVFLFPPFYLLPFVFRLVLPVGDEVEEFDGGHLEHLVPFTPDGLGHAIYIRNPTPPVSESANFRYIVCISFAFSGFFFSNRRIE